LFKNFDTITELRITLFTIHKIYYSNNISYKSLKKDIIKIVKNFTPQKRSLNIIQTGKLNQKYFNKLKLPKDRKFSKKLKKEFNC
jgi:hypothetical protein